MGEEHFFYEPGYNGKLVSLGGIVGKEGRGRVIMPLVGVTVDSNGVVVLDPNPKRIAALIQNKGPNTLSLSLGDNGMSYTSVELKIGEAMQIDANFPWTGGIYAICSGADTATILGSEVSVA